MSGKTHRQQIDVTMNTPNHSMVSIRYMDKSNRAVMPETFIPLFYGSKSLNPLEQHQIFRLVLSSCSKGSWILDLEILNRPNF